jgi:hypothetical protein
VVKARQWGRGIATADSPQRRNEREARARAQLAQLTAEAAREQEQRAQQRAEEEQQRAQQRQQRDQERAAVEAFFAEERKHYKALKQEEAFDLLADKVCNTNKLHPKQRYQWQPKLPLHLQQVQFDLHVAKFYPTAAHARTAVAQQATKPAEAGQQDKGNSGVEAGSDLDLLSGGDEFEEQDESDELFQ